MAEAKTVKLGLFENLGLKNSLVIDLFLPCGRFALISPKSQFGNVYVHASCNVISVYVTANDAILKMKDLSRDIWRRQYEFLE